MSNFIRFLIFIFLNYSTLVHSFIKEQLHYNLKQISIRQLQSPPPSSTLSCNMANGTFPTQDQLSVHHAEAIALTCMDFRLVDDTACFFNSEGLNNNYDAFVLAGASLGYNNNPVWAESFNNHVQLADFLHEANEIVVLDHASCGAYKLMFPNINWTALSSADEYQQHVIQLENFAAAMKYYYPNFTVQAYFMYLNGTAVNVPIQGTGKFSPPSPSSSNDQKLHRGDIAAIIIGVIFFLFIIGVGIGCHVLKKKKSKKSSQSSSSSQSISNKISLRVDKGENKELVKKSQENAKNASANTKDKKLVQLTTDNKDISKNTTDNQEIVLKDPENQEITKKKANA